MHTCAKFDQNIPFGSRVMSIFTKSYHTDSHRDYSAHLRVVKYLSTYNVGWNHRGSRTSCFLYLWLSPNDDIDSHEASLLFIIDNKLIIPVFVL